MINTHYIHSVLVPDFSSGRVCCVNQYHYESRKRRVVMRLVHTTGNTSNTVVYQHTMYNKSWSNISIKMNFKQITKAELQFVQYLEGCYISCLPSHSNDMTSWQSNSAENVSCNVAPFSYHHRVWWYNILHHIPCIRQTTFVNFKGKHA